MTVEAPSAHRSRSLRRTRSGWLNPSRILNSLLAVIVVGGAALLAVRLPTHGLTFFLEILVYGVANGAIYALLAIGYTMVFGIIELINFAHGDVFTLGGFISLSLLPIFGLTEGSTGWRVIPALLAVFVVTIILTGLINVAIERIAYRPLRHRSRLAPLIGAVGMSFLLEGIMFLWKGPFSIHYPDLLSRTYLPILGYQFLTVKDLVVVVGTFLLVVALSVFITRSALGKAMRATAQDRDGALLMGIDINYTIAMTFFIGAVLAGAGGMVFGLYYNTLTFSLGYSAGLVAFTGAVFGGIGNLPGAALGGLLIGMIAAFSDGYFDSIWTDVLVFSILIIVLIFKPNGLLGMRIPEK